jgi:hypothetical protein
MRFIAAVLCALTFMDVLKTEAACSWSTLYGPKQYYVACDDATDSVIPSLPGDAISANIEGFSGTLPEDLFRNRSLAVV